MMSTWPQFPPPLPTPSFPVILEGLVTSCQADGSLHLAAMGPEVLDARRLDRLVLKPFAGSRTADLLAATPEGVFHLSDDVLLLARVVTGSLTGPPAARPATEVHGWLLADACEAFEFRISDADTSGQRARLTAAIVARHSFRPFRGFNRAAHAVVEAAILFSRLHLLGPAEIQRQLGLLQPLIDKTASEREREAFELITTGCRP